MLRNEKVLKGTRTCHTQCWPYLQVGGWNDDREGRWEGGQVRGKGDDDQLLMGWKGVLCEWYGCRMETGRWRGWGGWGDNQHPAPLPQAAACGVVMVCECAGMMRNGNMGTRDTTPHVDDNVSTPCHCCEQQTTSLTFARGFFCLFYFI